MFTTSTDIDRKKYMYAIRLSLMVLTLFFIFRYLKIADETWVLFIFMTTFEFATVECMTKKGHQRALLLFCSLVYGLCVIFIFNNNYLMNIVALIGGFLVYCYFFIGTPLGHMGIVGCAILTLMLINHNDPILSCLRALIILTTIGVSIVVTRFFYPEYACDEVIKVEANLLSGLSRWIERFLETSSLDTEFVFIQEKTWHTETLKAYEHIDHMCIKDKSNTSLIEHHKRCFEQLNILHQLLHAALHYKKKPIDVLLLKQINEYFHAIQQYLLSSSEIEASNRPQHNQTLQPIWQDICYHAHLLEISVDVIVSTQKK